MDEPISTATSIRRTAMDLLARREHSRYELRQKLSLRFSENDDLIERELERLRSERLQSDERYAEVYLHSRAQRLYGPARIKGELRERGIDDNVVAAAFSAANIDWSTNAHKLESKKFGLKPPVDLREKAKRLRFLQYRGF